MDEVSDDDLFACENALPHRRCKAVAPDLATMMTCRDIYNETKSLFYKRNVFFVHPMSGREQLTDVASVAAAFFFDRCTSSRLLIRNVHILTLLCELDLVLGAFAMEEEEETATPQPDTTITASGPSGPKKLWDLL